MQTTRAHTLGVKQGTTPTPTAAPTRPPAPASHNPHIHTRASDKCACVCVDVGLGWWWCGHARARHGSREEVVQVERPSRGTHRMTPRPPSPTHTHSQQILRLPPCPYSFTTSTQKCQGEPSKTSGSGHKGGRGHTWELPCTKPQTRALSRVHAFSLTQSRTLPHKSSIGINTCRCGGRGAGARCPRWAGKARARVARRGQPPLHLRSGPHPNSPTPGAQPPPTQPTMRGRTPRLCLDRGQMGRWRPRETHPKQLVTLNGFAG